MAKKKRSKPPKKLRLKRAQVRKPSARSTRTKRKAKKPAVPRTELVPIKADPGGLIPRSKRESLLAWCTLYMTIEGSAGSQHTANAKKRDLQNFLTFFRRRTRSDHPDQWTRSVTRGFQRFLEKREAPSTVNRRLQTLKHTAKWIHRQREFLAGNPTERIGDLEQGDPEWQGQTDVEVTRVRSAAEQLVHL